MKGIPYLMLAVQFSRPVVGQEGTHKNVEISCAETICTFSLVFLLHFDGLTNGLTEGLAE